MIKKSFFLFAVWLCTDIQLTLAQTVTHDSFNNCSLWSGWFESWGGCSNQGCPTTPVITTSVNCSNSEVKLEGAGRGGYPYSIAHASRNFNFVSGRVYIVKVKFRVPSMIQAYSNCAGTWSTWCQPGYEFNIKATSSSSVSGEIIGSKTSSSWQDSYETLQFLYVPSSNFNTIILSGYVNGHRSPNFSTVPYGIYVDFVEIIESPCEVAGVLSGPESVCEGTINDLSAPVGSSYLWLKPSYGGTSQTGRISSGRPGSYTYEVLVLGSGTNGCIQRAVKVVEVRPAPPPLTVSTPRPLNVNGGFDVCAGETVTFSTTQAANYQWEVMAANGFSNPWSTIGNQQSLNQSFSSSTLSWNAALRVRTLASNGCFSLSPSLSLHIYANQVYLIGPRGTITPGQIQTYDYFEGESVPLSIQYPEGATRQWLRNGVPIAGAIGNSYVATTSGDYAVATSGCSTQIGTARVIFHPKPSISPSGVVCGPVTLTAPPGTNYVWSNGATTQSISVSEGTYSVSVTQVLGGEPRRTTSQPVTVNLSPAIAVSPVNPSICPGSSVNLTATGAATYLWSPTTGLSASTGSTVSANPSVTTTYSVTGISTNGCTSVRNVNVTVSTLSATIDGALSVCFGEMTTITANPGGTGYTYVWSTGATTRTIQAPAGSYTVTVYQNGCSGTASVYIQGYDCSGGGSCRGRVICARKRPDGTLELIPGGIYPNPANDRFLVILSKESVEGTSIRLIDMNGQIQLVDKIDPGQREKEIFLDRLSSGAYLVEFVDDGQPVFEKLVVKRE